ncbi:MAG: DsbA family protein [Calditerrivibrio sp.]|nr:DsbA family protein [Calditerrivibrio sp.]
MRLFFTLLLTFITTSLFANDIEKNLEKNLLLNFEKRGIKDVTIDVDVIKEIDEVKGYYLVKATIIDKKNNKKVDQYLVSNGNILLPDIIDITKGNSIVKDLIFSYDVTNVDVSKLTLIYGNKNAKNVIVKVSDFECPYCRKANEYLETKLNNNKKEVAVYLLHYPLSIHKKANLYARILEAGLKLGKNFTNELYSGKYDNMEESKIIETFGQMTGKKVDFEKLLNSKEIADKIKSHMEYAEKLGINSTPIIFINGRKVEGYNTQLIDKGFSMMK